MGFVIFVFFYTTLTFTSLFCFPLGKQPPVADNSDTFRNVLDEHYDIDYGDQFGPMPPMAMENKGYKQSIITQRDIMKAKSNEPFWKKWFAELLAASILLVLIILGICWYAKTHKYEGRHTHHGLSHGIGMSIKAQAMMHGATVPEMGSELQRTSLFAPSIPVQPLKPLKCPKPACVCEGPNRKPEKGRRRWNYKEDNESYAPA